MTSPSRGRKKALRGPPSNYSTMKKKREEEKARKAEDTTTTVQPLRAPTRFPTLQGPNGRTAMPRPYRVPRTIHVTPPPALISPIVIAVLSAASLVSPAASTILNGLLAPPRSPYEQASVHNASPPRVHAVSPRRSRREINSIMTQVRKSAFRDSPEREKSDDEPDDADRSTDLPESYEVEPGSMNRAASQGGSQQDPTRGPDGTQQQSGNNDEPGTATILKAMDGTQAETLLRGKTLSKQQQHLKISSQMGTPLPGAIDDGPDGEGEGEQRPHQLESATAVSATGVSGMGTTQGATKGHTLNTKTTRDTHTSATGQDRMRGDVEDQQDSRPVDSLEPSTSTGQREDGSYVGGFSIDRQRQTAPAAPDPHRVLRDLKLLKHSVFANIDLDVVITEIETAVAHPNTNVPDKKENENTATKRVGTKSKDTEKIKQVIHELRLARKILIKSEKIHFFRDNVKKQAVTWASAKAAFTVGYIPLTTVRLAAAWRSEEDFEKTIVVIERVANSFKTSDWDSCVRKSLKNYGGCIDLIDDLRNEHISFETFEDDCTTLPASCFDRLVAAKVSEGNACEVLGAVGESERIYSIISDLCGDCGNVLPSSAKDTIKKIQKKLKDLPCITDRCLHVIGNNDGLTKVRSLIQKTGVQNMILIDTSNGRSLHVFLRAFGASAVKTKLYTTDDETNALDVSICVVNDGRFSTHRVQRETLQSSRIHDGFSFALLKEYCGGVIVNHDANNENILE